MKKRYFIPLLIVFAFFGVFFAEKSALGAYLVNQNVGDTLSQSFSWNTRVYLKQLNVSGFSSLVEGEPFVIRVKSDNNPNWLSSWYDLSVNCSGGGRGTEIESVNISYDSGISTFDFSADWWGAVGCNNPTGIWISYPETTGANTKFYGSSSNTLTDSEAWWYTNTSASTGSDTNIDDLYLILEQEPPDSVGFTFPENATSTSDFSHFHLNWNVAEEMENRGIIIVNYSTDPDKVIADTYEKAYNCFYNINGCYRDVLVLENEMASSADETLFKHFNLSPSLWYAHAELFRDYDAPDWIFLASSTINFTITTAPKIDTFWEIPTSTITTSTPAQITCDPDDPFFQYSFCKLFLYLLVPQSDSFDKFSTLGQEIENKPPIGYFTQIKSILSNVNASGTPVFDIGNYSAFSASIFTPLRTGISWLLWLFFAVVIFNRVRHLEL